MIIKVICGNLISFEVLRCGLASDEPQAYEEALYLLATTVEGAEAWLWRDLIRALLDPIYVASVSHEKIITFI